MRRDRGRGMKRSPLLVRLEVAGGSQDEANAPVRAGMLRALCQFIESVNQTLKAGVASNACSGRLPPSGTTGVPAVSPASLIA